ncbi:MAG TPA: FAD-binding oxidoreductase [Chitinophagaceae bacterium]|nr:FAD-binding oxidoreductase [Chitinophagaceae bacterium]
MDTDVLVVGQGISGTFLSWNLYQRQVDFIVVDNGHPAAPSRVAAGIINPITGRRMATTWMAEELLAFAKTAYEEIGHYLGIQAITPRRILDFFPNAQMRDTFLVHLQHKDPFFHAFPEQNRFNHLFRYDFGCGEIAPAYTVHLELLLPAWRMELQRQNRLVSEQVIDGDIRLTTGGVSFGDIRARRVIFCDGSTSQSNPWFGLLPFSRNKGEALVLDIPDLEADYIYKKGFLLAPLAARNAFWLGASYEWNFADTGPSEKFRTAATSFLSDWLRLPFRILDHKAGLRPATLERRPFAGLHPVHQQLGILNGMGTKGCSLAPYFARQLTDHLLWQAPILPEADISRFRKILERG